MREAMCSMDESLFIVGNRRFFIDCHQSQFLCGELTESPTKSVSRGILTCENRLLQNGLVA